MPLKPKDDLSPSYVAECFRYNAETGLLFWKDRPDVSPHINARFRGKVAGTVGCGGYVRVSLNRKTYTAHRLVWAIVHREWPSGELDHINRIPSDNRISNLRLATRSNNNLNRGKRKNTAAALQGVSVRSSGAKRWQAEIKIDGKRKYLGSFATQEEAHRAYLAAKVPQ